MVPTVRLELTRLSPPPPQDGVSTNSTTSAGLARNSFPPLCESGHAFYFGTSPAFEPSGAGAASRPFFTTMTLALDASVR